MVVGLVQTFIVNVYSFRPLKNLYGDLLAYLGCRPMATIDSLRKQHRFDDDKERHICVFDFFPFI